MSRVFRVVGFALAMVAVAVLEDVDVARAEGPGGNSPKQSTTQRIPRLVDPGAGKAHGVSIIPTQIFHGADGKELARHQGFMDRDAILARWKALGVSL